MGAVQPARGRPRPATPVPQVFGHPWWYPRRWGRLLAVGLALILVAAVVPGARADDGVPPSVEPVGDETLSWALEAAAWQAQTSQAQPPVARQDITATSSIPQNPPAQNSEITGSSDLTVGDDKPQDPASLILDEHYPEGHQPGEQLLGGQQHAAATGRSGTSGE